MKTCLKHKVKNETTKIVQILDFSKTTGTKTTTTTIRMRTITTKNDINNNSNNNK
jgi:hypothetical protein